MNTGLKYVSIHAPAWGATEKVGDEVYRYSVSIHAPAWGATDTFLKCFRNVQGFNPRSRVGSDLSRLTA